MIFSRIAVLAPGLIGGSAALAATQAFPKAQLALWTRRAESVPAIRQLMPNADVGTDPALVRGSDLVLLAAPPSVLPSLVQSILPHLSPTTLVTDVSSIKESVEKAVAPLLQGKARWIGSHPMAGSEESGLAAARTNLFQKAPVILTPASSTSSETLRDATTFWQALGARVVTMSPSEHDAQVARISHLPHCLAATLVLAAGTSPLSLAGSGYRDTTRIAGGPASLWSEILLGNRSEILASLQTFGTSLARLTTALEKGDATALTKLLEEAAQVRRTLPTP